jgi:hypothetical protein
MVIGIFVSINYFEFSDIYIYIKGDLHEKRITNESGASGSALTIFSPHGLQGSEKLGCKSLFLSFFFLPFCARRRRR